MASERPNIRVVSETHLAAAEACDRVVAGDEVATEHSQPCDGAQMRGGVVTPAQPGISCVELKDGDTPQSALPLYFCSMLVYLGGDNREAIQITGAYPPPKVGADGGFAETSYRA